MVRNSKDLEAQKLNQYLQSFLENILEQHKLLYWDF